MTDKRLTVILFGADRNLWRGGRLQIRVTDLFASGGPRLVFTGETEESTLELILQLPFHAGQVYGFTFAAPDHRPAWHLLRRQDFVRASDNVERDDVILRLMLVPDEPGTSDLPRGFERLVQNASPFVAPGSGVDEAGYAGLNDAAKMAFLNVEAKLRESTIDGSSLLSFVRGIRHVAVDRVFLLFDAALKARMPRAGDFANAPGHGAPKAHPELPGHPDSWKHTRFAEGNVQLSFSADPFPFPAPSSTSLVHSADVDVDLGRGLAHAAEWLENNVFRPGHKTNQALIYGLLYSQNVLPRYVLDPAPATTARGLTQLRRVSEPAGSTARKRARGAEGGRGKAAAKKKRPTRSASPTGRKRGKVA